MDSNNTPSILFVCLGNICRSPTAEEVFRAKAQDVGASFEIDSAGTGGYKTGAPPDKRSQNVALSRGYNLSKLKCRKISDHDYQAYDYIIAMDNENVSALKRKCPDEHHYKISLFLSHCDSEFDEVPDPYYAGLKGFELVLDLIEEAADGLLLKLAS